MVERQLVLYSKCTRYKISLLIIDLDLLSVRIIRLITHNLKTQYKTSPSHFSLLCCQGETEIS